jgi:hypothetical protein
MTHNMPPVLEHLHTGTPTCQQCWPTLEHQQCQWTADMWAGKRAWSLPSFSPTAQDTMGARIWERVERRRQTANQNEIKLQGLQL